jgi:hypothetical protein
MDLFAITCTTCKSRLKVREEGAIGQILACPNCGGMVMVKPPPNWSAGTAAKMEEPTISEVVPAGPRFDQTAGASAFEAVEDLLSDAPPRMQTPPAAALPAPAATMPAPTATLPAPLVAGRARFVGGPANGAAKKPLPQAVVLNGDVALAPPPPAEPDFAVLDPKSAQLAWRYWAMMLGSVAMGIVLAFAAVSAAMYFLRDHSKTIADAGPDQAPDVPPAVTPVTTTPIPAASPAEVPAALNSTPLVDTPVDPSPMADPPPVVAAVPPADTDPIGLVKPPTPPAAVSNPNDPLAKFDKLLGAEDDPPPESSRPTPAAAPAEPAPDRPALPRPPPRDVDVARRLADPLAGIETSSTPLADFLNRLSDLTNIPITLEPDWLAFAPATPKSPIVIQAANTTVGDALTKALLPLRLAAVASGDQLVIGLAQPQPPATIQVKAQDLASSEDELNELAELLKGLIEPGSWAGEEGGAIAVDAAAGVLLVKHQKSVQAQVHLVCEKLRTARKRPNILKLDPALFQLQSRWAKAQARLQMPISLNFSQPTRLTAVLDQLGEAADLRILVDWRDVASLGWNPDADATLVADKQPLAEALDELLNPLELSWRVIDGSTLQVVTPARLAERHEVELYPAADLVEGDAAGEALLSKLQSTLGPALFKDGGGSGELRLDPVSKCLIAALPQLKQRDLEALLAKWREEKAAR